MAIGTAAGVASQSENSYQRLLENGASKEQAKVLSTIAGSII
jgi:hypothetical protein